MTRKNTEISKRDTFNIMVDTLTWNSKKVSKIEKMAGKQTRRTQIKKTYRTHI